MAAKMAVYNKNIRQLSLRLVSFKNLHAKFYLTDFELKHYPCNIPVMLLIQHSECVIFKMASMMVPDKFYNPVGATSYL